MATMTWKQSGILVGIGGKIELVVPGLAAGNAVDVLVELPEPKPADRPMGFLKGKVGLAADFDEPLTDFDEYA